MNFLEPVRLWGLLLVPVLLAGYVVLQRRRGRYAIRFTNLTLLDTVAPRRVNWRQHLAVGLALLTLAGGVVLFAKPSQNVRVPVSVDSTYTVVMVMDSSLSMGAEDVLPDRHTAATVAAKRFVTELPSNYRVSVVSFAEHATVRLAPTLDHAEALAALGKARLRSYTATGEGIFTAVDVIKSTVPTGSNGRRAAFVVLLSDGKSTAGRSPFVAARYAEREGVPIYTVAIGTHHAFIENQGQLIDVRVASGQLKTIARISGGSSYVAGSLEDLTRVYGALNGELQSTLERRDVTSRYLGWLVLLMLLSTVGGLFVASRWP